MLMIEKSYKNDDLGIEITSFINEKLIVWFKAKEVAQVLNYKNTEKAIKRHVSENHKRKILFTNQHETHGCSMTYFLDEAGFYELVFKSKLPTAKSFCDWVCAKVLGFNIILVLKPGFYKFVFRSKLETAKIFSKLVFILVNILFFKPFIIPTNKSIRYWSLINYHLIYQLHSINKLLFIPLISSQCCT